MITDGKEAIDHLRKLGERKLSDTMKDPVQMSEHIVLEMEVKALKKRVQELEDLVVRALERLADADL